MADLALKYGFIRVKFFVNPVTKKEEQIARKGEINNALT
jgi:hypothetical protein